MTHQLPNGQKELDLDGLALEWDNLVEMELDLMPRDEIKKLVDKILRKSKIKLVK